MKKFIAVTILAIITFLVGAYFVLQQSRSSSTMVDRAGNEFENLSRPLVDVHSTSSTSTTSLSGDTAPVRRTLSSEEYAHISRKWTLVNEASGAYVNFSKHYSMYYDPTDPVLRVEIKDEPASLYRTEIEQELYDTLQVSAGELCNISSVVNRRTELTNFVDFQRIGFKGCTGSLTDEELLYPPF